MEDKFFRARLELFKRHITRHYLEFEFLTMTSNTVITELVLHDLDIHIYIKKDWNVFIAYDIVKKMDERLWMCQSCKSIELDFEWFFQMYETILAYIRNFNNRKNEKNSSN